MEDELVIEGKSFISSKRLSASLGYTHDYISRLCREGKIQGKLVGRNWFVDQDSLTTYKKVSRDNQKALLSEQTKTKQVDNNIPPQEVIASEDLWDELVLHSETKFDKPKEGILKTVTDQISAIYIKKDLFLNTISSQRTISEEKETPKLTKRKTKQLNNKAGKKLKNTRTFIKGFTAIFIGLVVIFYILNILGSIGHYVKNIVDIALQDKIIIEKSH